MNFQKHLLILFLCLAACFSYQASAQADTSSFAMYHKALQQRRVCLDTTLRIEPVKKGGYLSPTVEAIQAVMARMFSHYSEAQHWASCDCAPIYELNWMPADGKDAPALVRGGNSPLLYDGLNLVLMQWSGKIHLTFYEDGYLAMELRQGQAREARYYRLNRFGSGGGPSFSSYLSMLSTRFQPQLYDTLARQVEALEAKIHQLRKTGIDSMATYRLLYVTYAHQGWSASAQPRQSQRCFVVEGGIADTLIGHELKSIEGAGYLRMLLNSGALSRAIPNRDHDSIASQVEALKDTQERLQPFPALGLPQAYGDRYVVIKRAYSEHDAMDDIDDKTVYYLEKVKR